MSDQHGGKHDGQSGDSGHEGGGHGGNQSGMQHDMRGMYLRFVAMIATSTVVMYFITYTNVFNVSHIHFSEERVYMALVPEVEGSRLTCAPILDRARSLVGCWLG